VLEVSEIKTVPYVPLSHPFVERLIGSIRREFLDQMLFWTATDLEDKLVGFQHYYNEHRTHTGLNGRTPEPPAAGPRADVNLSLFTWQRHCRGCTKRQQCVMFEFDRDRPWKAIGCLIITAS
jgi:putative transposase